MHKIISIIGAIASMLGAALIAYMLYQYFSGAFDNGAGMAILALQLWGVIAAGFGLVLGIAGLVMAKHKDLPAHGASKIAITASLCAFAALIAGMIFT